jgi:DNA polymerase-3 subunit epsilon
MNTLPLERPIVVFDIESTGVDIAVDRIISLAALRIEPEDFLQDARELRGHWIVNPMVSIPAAVSKVHGFTNDMLKDKPLFKSISETVHTFFQGADLCGYNLRNFDIPMLWEEFYRCKIEWNLSCVKVVDASEIFRRKEPRTLTAAVEKFCGRKHEGAHDAMADVLATWEVLHGQRKFFSDIGDMGVSALAEFSCSEEFEGQPARRLDTAGHIIETADGIARYTARRVKGVPVVDDPGFGGWMLRNSFPANTKLILQQLLSA